MEMLSGNPWRTLGHMYAMSSKGKSCLSAANNQIVKKFCDLQDYVRYLLAAARQKEKVFP